MPPVQLGDSASKGLVWIAEGERAAGLEVDTVEKYDENMYGFSSMVPYST